MTFPVAASRITGNPQAAIARWNGPSARPFMPHAPSGYVLSIVNVFGSTTATYAFAAGTVTRNLFIPAFHTGCSRPVASRNTTVPTMLIVSVLTNVAKGGF